MSELPVHFSVVTSKRRKARLVDNLNHTYNVKRKSASGTVTWQCSIRNKAPYCTATVKQDEDVFTLGNGHTCTGSSATNFVPLNMVVPVIGSNHPGKIVRVLW